MEIRKANKNDFELFSQMACGLDAVHREARPDIVKKDTSKSRTVEWYDEIVTNPKKTILFAFEEGEALGFAMVEVVPRIKHPVRFKPRYLQLINIFVYEQYRNQKVGRALYQAVEEIAKKKNIKHIKLTVWSFNQSAIAFYKGLGFKEFSVTMEKDLD